MKTTVIIEADMSKEQEDVLVQEIMNVCEMINIKLKVHISKKSELLVDSDCDHEFVSREYSSQPFGTCMVCKKTIVD